MLLAYGRPFWPLFLHVLGAMVLVGSVFVVTLVSWIGWRRNEPPVLRRTAFAAAAAVAVPAFLLMRIAGQWIYSKEGWSGEGDPTWLGIGYGVGDAGLLVLLATTGVAFWWKRSGKPLAGRILAGVSTVYLLMLALAWLAMSGKWG